ncbi:MAG: N-acetylglucosamine-6-phosphate deacetylase [Chlorobi bacterium]|nr:N-acetylglucosamine-6-phosphate deacetylase [Chlorobiota bacterium]
MKKLLLTIILIPLLMAETVTGQPVSSLQGRIYTDGSPVLVRIKNGKIAETVPLPPDSSIPQVYIAPGLIDIQINGYMGVDFTGSNLTIEGIIKVTKALWKEGITSYLPTVITGSDERLKTNFKILAGALTDPELKKSIPGFHLEGPYISPVKGFRGAHLAKYIRPPDWNEFIQYQKAAGNGIKLITVAPEIEGAIPFIRKAVENGIVVSLGHHNGSAKDIEQAVAAGAALSTHLGNGCANMINRHNNPIWPQLSNDRLSVSIIVDGYHLTKEEVRTFYKVKGPGKTILISDDLDLAGLKPGEYIRGERKVLLTPNVIKYPAENVLAGAASPLRKDVGNMMRFTQCSLEDAVNMATRNPAELLKLKDIGKIQTGYKANLILFTIKNGEIIIQKTIVDGKVVYLRK